MKLTSLILWISLVLVTAGLAYGAVAVHQDLFSSMFAGMSAMLCIVWYRIEIRHIFK